MIGGGAPVRRAGSADGKRKRRNRAGRISKTTGRIRTKPSSFERGNPGGSIGMYHLFLFDVLRGCSSV